MARAAIEGGVAKKKIEDWQAYEEELKERMGFSKEVIRVMIHKAQKSPKTVVYPEGEEEKIIRAAHVVKSEKIASPVLLGNEKIIRGIMIGIQTLKTDAGIAPPHRLWSIFHGDRLSITSISFLPDKIYLPFVFFL